MRRGFTLVEILVVVAIIGVLSTIVSINVINAQKTARDSKRSADVSTIKTALGLYYQDHGRYPQCDNGNHCNSNGPWEIDESNMSALTTYLNPFPRDPFGFEEGVYSGVIIPANRTSVSAATKNADYWYVNDKYDGYGILIGYETKGTRGCSNQGPFVNSSATDRCFCKTGTNVIDSWWNPGISKGSAGYIPVCQ